MIISSSRAAAFCNVAISRCKKTSETGLLTVEDEDGLKDACAHGWSWLLVQFKAEQLAPALPAFLQMVLNSVHSVSLGVQELEAAPQIALLCMSGQSLKDAVQSVTASKPQCVNYIEVWAILRKTMEEVAGFL